MFLNKAEKTKSAQCSDGNFSIKQVNESGNKIVFSEVHKNVWYESLAVKATYFF